MYTSTAGYVANATRAESELDAFAIIELVSDAVMQIPTESRLSESVWVSSCCKNLLWGDVERLLAKFMAGLST